MGKGGGYAGCARPASVSAPSPACLTASAPSQMSLPRLRRCGAALSAAASLATLLAPLSSRSRNHPQVLTTPLDLAMKLITKLETFETLKKVRAETGEEGVA